MLSAVLAFTVVTAASAGGAVESSPAPAPLQLSPKAAIATMNPNHSFAPFVAPLGANETAIVAPADARLNQSRSSCGSDRSLCYDPTSGRIIYKPARALMPVIPGLQRENISVKRDKIVLRYTF